MHDTVIKLKNGKTYVKPIYRICLVHKIVILFDEDLAHKFEDIESAITKEDRISMNEIGDVNELERWNTALNDYSSGRISGQPHCNCQ